MAKFRSTTDVVPAIYKPGERFAQLVIVPFLDMQIEEVVELSGTDREEGGFGSTGDKDISAANDNQSSLETKTAVTNSDNEEQAADTIQVSEQV